MDSFRQTSHSLPWRTAFEFNAAIVWAICASFSLVLAAYSSLPARPFVFCAAVSVIFIVIRLRGAFLIWNLRVNLLGKGLMLTSMPDYLKHCEARPSDLWLGRGFTWEKHHTQRLYDLRRTDQKQIRPPDWYVRMRGMVLDQQAPNAAGIPMIHGVGEKEVDIHLPFELLEGNSLILGTTGAGKTTLLRIVIASCVRRGDCVIVIDPKGDKSLVSAMRDSCALTPGRERDFVYFQTAFAQTSVRYDVLKNFDRVTSLASRISAQIPSKTGSDQFVAFSWNVLMVNCQLLVLAGIRPTIARIRQNVTGGLENILLQCCDTYFSQHLPERDIRDRKSNMKERADKLPKPSKTTSDDLAVAVAIYQACVRDGVFPASEALEAGISLYMHDRAHYGKMISSLIPVLAMLDAGELGGLLSPRYDDVDDLREVFDSDRVVEGNKVMYIGLDALSDSVVSSAVGSIIVADLAAVAGARYNYGAATTMPRRITLIVDEASEVVSAPFQQLASKGRGSGFTLWASSQTVPDYIAKLGSQEKALSTLGNFNNLICLRIKDKVTCDFVSEQIGMAFVDSRSYGLNTSSHSDAAATGFTGGEGVTVSDKLIEVVPPDILGMLPNHQYFALLAGGRLSKGRQPVIT